ncbi:MAG: hypothetical protein VBE63_01045 [Lamprobacter sp.]|uniref:hypothetical protein n=1 Tax=Lamprobacter sp. TaxID=3100796 RepID=UPI002B25E781|nr:hypothetical protein [Lamprobacter sp.]MEA3638512.1 hypothetical protein [Lamprobacter sp.]
MISTPSSSSIDGELGRCRLDPMRERLNALERRSLLAEQARQQAHRLRSPLSVIGLVSETLQIDLGDDRSYSERLQRVLDAASTLSSSLRRSLESNRFADGPKRAVDVARVAADVVRAFGGRVVSPTGDDSAEAESEGLDQAVGAEVLIDEQGLEAALVHLLRLIGVGYAGNARVVPEPLLRVEQDQHAGRVRLRLTLTHAPQPLEPVPTERADYGLMLKVVERVTRDQGGLLVLSDHQVSFELPTVSAVA